MTTQRRHGQKQKKEKNIFMTNQSTSLKDDKDQIEYLTNQNKFYRTKLAQAAVKIQELKRELIRKEEPNQIVDNLRKTGHL
jgi:hypothetical protein